MVLSVEKLASFMLGLGLDSGRWDKSIRQRHKTAVLKVKDATGGFTFLYLSFSFSSPIFRGFGKHLKNQCQVAFSSGVN